MENIYRQYFEQMPCYVTIQDQNLRIIDTNKKYRDDFGQAIGRYCFQVYKNRTDKCPKCPVEKTFQDGKKHSNEELIQLKDGKKIPVVVWTSPITDNTDNVVAVMEMSTDISEVKQLQEKYRALFSEVPCYISVQDKNLKIIDANRLFKDDFGDCIGSNCYKVYKQRDKPCPDCLVMDSFGDGQPHHTEEIMNSLEGEPRNVLCHSAPLRNASGKVVAVMEMFTDITDIRKLQSKLASLGLIVGSSAHDIKGFIGGIDGGRYLVESGIKKENFSRIKQGWEMVQRNLHRIRRVTLNLLYSAKDRDVNWELVDISNLIEDIHLDTEDMAKTHGIDLKVKGEENLEMVEGDGSALYSMLMNLVENAYDACRMDSQKDEHRVEIDAYTESNRVVIKVSDNGVGMDQENREKAFSLFFSSKGSQGTGLGLYVANKVVKNHGGTILIDSQPGKGTNFIIKLPQNYFSTQEIVNREQEIRNGY